MTTEGVDALGHPEPTALRAAGRVFVGQYLKALSRPRVDAYHAAGIDVVLIAETDGRGSLGGAARGVQLARAAMVAAAALGAPPAAAIYLAEVDFDPTPAELPIIVDFYRGAQTILAARLGGYGGYAAIKAMFDARVVTYGMQTYGWSRGKWDGRAQIQQYLNAQHMAGATVDFDRATTAAFGAWTAAPAPAPAPKPIPSEDEDMAMKQIISEYDKPGPTPDALVLVDMNTRTWSWVPTSADAAALVAAGAIKEKLSPALIGTLTEAGPDPHA